MTFGLLNILMLAGLAGLAIPPLIHLLHRRRFDVVDWGAMQFLLISETTRRRLLIEELLLMLLRMGLIGVLVLGLAAPYVISPGLPTLASRPNRDVVIVFDGSASMASTGSEKTPHEAAKEWASAIIKGLAPGDGVSLLLARQQVVPVLGEPTHDHQLALEKIRDLPPPGGGNDWPEAVREALRILEDKSRRPQRDIILLSDGQRSAWAEKNLDRWKLLAGQLGTGSAIQPRVWLVNLDAQRVAKPPNWSLLPLRASRATVHVGHPITFRTALQLYGQESYQPPRRLRLEVDGQPVRDLEVPPAQAKLEKGQVTIAPIEYAFDKPGSHVLSVIVEPEPAKDLLSLDNRQDFAVEVLPPLPVLLVDGDDRPKPKTRGTDYLRDALSPAIDPAPTMKVRVVPIQEFTPALLEAEPGKEAGLRPRVLVLANVARLTAEQQDGVAQFLARGGGVLVTLGERVDEQAYNKQLYRNGQGWLPVALDQFTTAEMDHTASPQPASFVHPALERFRSEPSSGLANARFRHWWKLLPGTSSTSTVTGARLDSKDPLLVEGRYRGGRVMVCTVPLDKSWVTNLPDLPEFPVLAHELVNSLAGVRAGEYGPRSAEYNVPQGQPLRYRLENGETPGSLSLEPPAGDKKPLAIDGLPRPDVYLAQLVQSKRGPEKVSGPLNVEVQTPFPDSETGTEPQSMVVFKDTSAPGIYRLRTARETFSYVVESDPRESDLAPCDDKDWEAVAEYLPMTYIADRDPMHSPLAKELYSQELWWWLLLGVIGLLCLEVWLTRRIVKGR